jgi:acylphosphatase
MNAPERIVRLTIEGRVQGVGFRAFVADEAHERRLEGWVRNRLDGSVEALVAGAGNLVDDMIGICRRGPPGAHVDILDVEEGAAPQPPAGDSDGIFLILPTV